MVSVAAEAVRASVWIHKGGVIHFRKQKIAVIGGENNENRTITHFSARSNGIPKLSVQTLFRAIGSIRIAVSTYCREESKKYG